MQWNTVTSSPYFLPLAFPIFALTCTVSYHMSIVMAHSLCVHRYAAIHWSWRNLPVVTLRKRTITPAGFGLACHCTSNHRYCQFISKTAVPRLDYSISQDAIPPSSSYILTSFSSVLLNIHDGGNNIDIPFRTGQSNQFPVQLLSTDCHPGQKVFCKPKLCG